MKIDNYDFLKEIKELKNELAFESFLLFEWIQEEYIAFNFKFKKYLVFDTFDEVLSLISNSIWNISNEDYYLNSLKISYWIKIEELNNLVGVNEEKNIKSIIETLFNKFMYILIKRLNGLGIDFDIAIKDIAKQPQATNNSNIVVVAKLVPAYIFEYQDKKASDEVKRYLDNLIININKYLDE